MTDREKLLAEMASRVCGSNWMAGDDFDMAARLAVKLAIKILERVEFLTEESLAQESAEFSAALDEL